MFYKKNTFFLILYGCIQCVLTEIPVYDIDLDNLLNMQLGLGWPHALVVAKGHEALLKLTQIIVNQQSCMVTTPNGVTFDVNSPPSNRYEKWTDACGVRVRNVEASDEGRWRLTATRGNDSITGWSAVHVKDDIPSYTPTPLLLQDGTTQTEIELTSVDNSYCLVAKPFSESSLVSGHCSVTLERTSRAVQGNWNILLGVPGLVAELQVQKPVTVEGERLDVGYVRDTSANTLNLYCNMLHTNKNITFCRFQKTTSSSGYNVMDGLSDGIHSYYGEGFAQKHCGMTIENPTAQDYGTWRCSVGLQQRVGVDIEPTTPMQALISVPPSDINTRVVRNIQTNGEELKTIFVQEDASFTIMCRADVSLKYCWFQHPNGSQYAPVPLVDEEQPFWYTGESLTTGDCGITFAHVAYDEMGEWICHMGPSQQLGVEVIDRVHLRVTGPLAANQQEVTVARGGSVVLYCHTSNGKRPLQYCRFLSPLFVGFSVDSSVTEENAILGRYHFSPERHLNYGDCSLTINPVQQEDIGKWTCAALLEEETMESKDFVTVHMAPSTISQAGIAGMVVGIITLVVLLVGVLLFKRYRTHIYNSNTREPVISFDSRRISSSTTSSEGTVDNRHVTIST